MPLDPEVARITRGMLRAPSERPIEESMTTPEPRVSQLPLGLAVEQPATLPSIGIAPEWKDQQRLWGHSFHPMCSYLASFPAALAHAFIARYSRRGDVVLDPFSGRGTTPLQASAEGRIGVGNDLNPFAHLLTASKVEPATRAEAMTRLAALRLAWASESAEWSALAERVAARSSDARPAGRQPRLADRRRRAGAARGRRRVPSADPRPAAARPDDARPRPTRPTASSPRA